MLSIWIILHEIENSILMLWNENDIRKQSLSYRFLCVCVALRVSGYQYFDRWRDIGMKFDKKKERKEREKITKVKIEDMKG